MTPARPRIARGISFTDYSAEKALSASGAWTLSEECPARFWQQSPWNPKREPETAQHFDIGKALHLAVLEPDALTDAVVLISGDSYRTKAAQDQRDDAYAAGKTPLLVKDLDLIVGMQRAIESDPYAAALLGDGTSEDSEVSFFWDDPRSGVPCKGRADRISRKHRAIIDLKTAANGAPGAWAAAAWRDGHPLRAAWYLDGWREAAGETMDRYAFIVVEKEQPHIVSIYDLSERALGWGRMIARRALARFVECERGDKWREGYGPPSIVELPTWAEYRLADREVAGEFSSADAKRAFDFLAP